MGVSRIVPAILGCMAMGAAHGQAFPSKPIRIITSSAGGGSDFVARLLAAGMAGPLGQPVVVENRSPSNLATETGARAAPDGHTVSVVGGGMWIFPLLNKATYEPLGSFAPISWSTREVYVLAVNAALPVKSIAELIALAKSKPGQLNYSSGSPGSSSHIAFESFKTQTGTNIARVSYKGPAPAIAGLVGGDTQVTIYDAPLLMPHVKSGKLRALAVTSATPSLLVPGLPTVASVLPGFESGGATGLVAPAKTPAAIIERLHQESVRAIMQPDLREKLLNIGAEPVGSTPEQFRAYIEADMARAAKVIKDADIKME